MSPVHHPWNTPHPHPGDFYNTSSVSLIRILSETLAYFFFFFFKSPVGNSKNVLTKMMKMKTVLNYIINELSPIRLLHHLSIQKSLCIHFIFQSNKTEINFNRRQTPQVIGKMGGGMTFICKYSFQISISYNQPQSAICLVNTF